MSDWVTVAAVAELTPGTRRIIDVDDVQIAVFNLNGEFYAIEDVCTHDYAPLADAKLEGDEIICPRHGARFCIRTGAVTAPPAYEAVTTFPVRIHEGMVQVRDPRWD
ncbi:MAG: non-heme iron oxygenase ferredoxin subunit [Pseudomonadota bacterium]